MSLLEGAHWNTEPVVSGAAPASSPGHSWSRVPGKPPAVRRARESAANNRLRIGTAVMRLTPPLIVVQFIIGSLLAMCLNQEHQITSQATFIEATNRQDKSPTDVPMAIGQQRQQNQRPHRNGLPEERVIPVARRGYYRDQATRRRATAAAVSTARPELIVHRSRAESQLPDRDPTGMGELDDALNLISSSAPKRRPHWRLNPAIERSSTTSFKLLPERHNRFLTLEEDDDDDVNSMEKDDYETASSMADSDKLNGRSFNGRQTDRALHESSSPAGSTSGGAAAAVKTMSSSPATRGRRHQLLQQAPPPTAPMPILNEHQRQHIKTRLEIQRAEQAYRNKLMELKQRYLTNRAITDRAYYILLTIYAILITFGTISNSLICLTVIFKPKILSPRNIFIVNLAGSDLLLCVFTMPLTFIEVSMKIWQMGLIPCKLVAGLQATSIFVSTISITAIALDRYKVIVYPTHQETASGTRGALLLLASVWIGALSLSLPLFTYRTVEHHEITSPQIQSDPFQARSSNEALASQTTQSVLSAAIDYHNNNLNSNNHHNHNHNPNNSSSTTTSGTIRSSSPMQYVSASALTTTMASTAVSAGAPNAAGVSVTMPMMPMMMSNNTTTTGSGIVSSSKQYPNQLVDSFDFCIEAWPFAHGRGIFSVISMILQYVLPITIVSFVYTKISRKLQKRLIRRQRLTQLECQQKRQLNLIKRTHTMLVSVSLVFGLSWLPLNLMNVASDFSSEFRQFFDDQTFRIIFAVCHLIGCSSACSNPILYGFLNENFRKEFHQVYNHHARILMRRIRRLVAWLNCCWLTRKLFRRCASSRLDLREGGRTGGVGVGDAGTSVGDGDGDNDDEDYEYYAQGHNMVDSGAGVGGLRRNNRQVHNKRKLPNNNSYSVANGNDDDDVANNSSSSSSGANYLRGRNGADYDDEDEDDNNDRNNNNNDDYGDDDSDYDYEDNSSAFTSNSYTGGSSSAVFSSSSSSSIGSAGARVTQHRRKQPIAHFSSLNVIPLNELSLNIDRTGGGAPASGATHVNERAASHAELLASGGCAIGSNQEHGQSKTLEDGGPVPRSWSRNGSQMGKPPRQTNPPNSQQQSPQLKAATQNAARLTMMAAASENEMVAYEEVVAYDEMVVGANNSNSNSNNNNSNNKTLDDDKRRRLSHQTVTSVSGGRQTLGGRTMRLCLCISSSSSAETLGGMGAAQGPVSISIPNGLEQSDAAVVTTARRQDGDGGDGDDDGAPAQNGRIMQAIARDSAENNNDDDGLTKPAASQHQDRHQHQRQGQRHRDHQGLLGQAATLASDEMRRRGRLRRRRKQRMRQRLIQLECECQCHKEELELKVKKEKEKEKEKEKAGEMRAIIGSEPTTTGSMGQVRQGRQALPELMLPPPPADYDTRSESRSKRPGLVQCRAAFTGRRVWLRFLGVGGSGSGDTVDGPVDGGPQTIGATGDNGGGTKETNNNNSEPEGAGSRSIAPPGEQQQQQTPSDGNQLRPDTTTTATDSRQPLKRSQSDLEHQWRVVEHKRGDPTSGVGPSRANDGGNKQQSTIERNQSSGTESVVYQQQKRQHCNNCKHSSVSSSGVAATAARLMMASSGTSGQRRPSRKHHHPHAHRHHHHHHQHRQRSHHRRGPSSRPSTAAANPSGGSDGGTAAARAGGGPKADLARQRTKTLAVPQTVGAASGCGGAVGAAAPQVQKKRPLSISSWMSSLRRRKSVSSNQEAASAPSNSSRSESMTRQRSGAAQAQDTPTILVKSSDSRSPTSTMAACAIPPPPPNNTPRQQSSPFSLRNNARQQQKQQQRKQQQQQQQLTGPVGKGTFCLAPGSTGASKQVGTVYLSIEMADRKRADSVFSFDNQREKSTSVVVMLADDDDEEEEDYYRKGPAGGKGGAESSLGAPTSGPPPLALDKLSGSSGHRLDDGCAAAAAAEIGVEQTAGSVDAKIAGPAVSKPGFHTGRAAGGGAPPASLRYHTGMINSNQRSQTNESPGSEQTSSGSLRLVGGGAATNEREPANQTTMTTTTTTMTQNFGPPCTGRSGRAGSNNAPGGGGVCNQINNASDYLSGKDEAEEQEPARSSSATSLRNQLAHQPPTGKTRSAASCPRDTATKLATKTPNLPQLQLQSQQPPPPPTISTGMQESKFIDCSHEEANVDGQKLASSEKEEESDDAVMSHGSEQQERRRQQQRQTNQSNNNKHQHQKRQHDAPVQLDTDAGRGGSDVLVSNESHALQEEQQQQQQQQQQQDEDNNDRELRADPSSKGSPPCLSQTIDSSNSSNSSSSSASSASGSISPLSALSYTSACLSHHSSSVSSCTCSLTASSFSSGQLNATTTTTTTRDSSISISTPATTNNSYHQQHHHNQQQQQRHNHQRHFTEARAVGGGTLQQSTAISSSQHNMTTKTAGIGHRNEMTGSFADTSGCSDLAAGDRKSLAAEKEPLGAGMERQQRNQQQQRLYLRRLRTHSATLGNELGRSARTAAAGAVANTAAARKPSNLDSSAGLNANTNTNATTITTNHTPHHIKDAEQAHRNSHSELVSYSNSSSMAVLLTQAASTTQERLKPAANMSETAFSLEALDGGAPPPPLASPGSRADQASCKLLTENKFTGLAGGVGGEQRNRVATTNKSSRRLSTQSPQVDATAAAVDKCSSIPSSLTSTTQTPSRPFSPGHKIGPSNTGPSINNNNTDEDNNKTGLTNHTSASRLSLGSSGSELMMTTADEADS